MSLSVMPVIVRFLQKRIYAWLQLVIAAWSATKRTEFRRICVRVQLGITFFRASSQSTFHTSQYFRHKQHVRFTSFSDVAEREQRDLEQMPQAKRRRLSTGQNEAAREASQADPEQEPLRPGDKGFVMRARVPVPSHKDYVVRPKWNIEGGDDDEDQMQFRKRGKGKSRKDARLEKHIKNFAERKKNNKMQRAVGISIQGNKMPLAWQRGVVPGVRKRPTRFPCSRTAPQAKWFLLYITAWWCTQLGTSGETVSAFSTGGRLTEGHELRNSA